MKKKYDVGSMSASPLTSPCSLKEKRDRKKFTSEASPLNFSRSLEKCV